MIVIYTLRLPLKGKLSAKPTDEVVNSENLSNLKTDKSDINRGL